MVMNTHKKHVGFLALLALLTASGSVQAGGLNMYEIGTPDTGLASAGYAARADDPGTVLTNPAGMTRLKGKQVLIGIQPLYGHVQFSDNGGTSPGLGADNGGNAVGLMPGLSAFMTNAITPDLSFGFGVFSNFGLGLSYNDNWAGRYYVQQATLIGVSMMPAAAYRISDQWSAGVAMNIMCGYFKDKVAINNAGSQPDGQMEVKDLTIGIGANVGILYEPYKGSRFGVTYNSPIRLDFSDTPSFGNIGAGKQAVIDTMGFRNNSLDLSMTVPQGVMASFYQELNPQWALLGNFGWQNWSNFGKVDVAFGANSLTTNSKFNDTWHGALGAQYRLSEPWLVSAGVAYDSSMMGEANPSPSLPVSWTWRYALGTQYALSTTTQFGLAYEYAYSGNLNVIKTDLLPGVGGRGNLSGSYANVSIQFISANVTWKF